MCFSVEADVAIGLAVGVVGVDALRHVTRPQQWPLAALPIVFAAHQLNEAFVWWGLDGTLARQVRWYLAMKDFCRDYGVDFCGLTGQLDMTEYEDGITADLPEALLNDIADWEDELKKPIITWKSL